MDTHPLISDLVKNWWVVLLRGIFAVLFGILAFALPGLTLTTLVLLYGVYVLVDGVTALWFGGKARSGWLLLSGVLGVIVGIVTFIFPGITAVALLYLIAAWAIVRGVFEIVTAIHIRKIIDNEWMLILGGLLSIVFGGVLAAKPAAGALAMVWLIGAFAFAFGVMMIVMAFRLHGLRR